MDAAGELDRTEAINSYLLSDLPTGSPVPVGSVHHRCLPTYVLIRNLGSYLLHVAICWRLPSLPAYLILRTERELGETHTARSDLEEGFRLREDVATDVR